MKISVIIPTYNEENSILKLLKHLKAHRNGHDVEILVVDGKSEDQTVEMVRQAGFKIIVSEIKSRAVQMNTGAEISIGDILYFVHADSIPPTSYIKDIKNAVGQGYKAGCYRFRFDSDHFLLKINSYFTRFDRLMCRGGDQTLFISRNLFYELNGFKNGYHIMEDFDIIQRIKKRDKFLIMPKDVIVSARKYEQNSYLKVNAANFTIFMMYFLGASQNTMLNTYKKLIHFTKFGKET